MIFFFCIDKGQLDNAIAIIIVIRFHDKFYLQDKQYYQIAHYRLNVQCDKIDSQYDRILFFKKFQVLTIKKACKEIERVSVYQMHVC